MEYLRQLLEKSPDIKPKEKFDYYIEMYWDYVDEILSKQKKAKYEANITKSEKSCIECWSIFSWEWDICYNCSRK